MIALAGPPASASSKPKEPIDRILGLRLGAPEAKVRHELEKLGTRYRPRHGEWARGDGAEKELWSLRDPRFDFLMVHWDDDRRLDVVQVWIRQPHHDLRYSDLGDLARAKKLGNTIYVWDVAARNGEPVRRVEARGTDPALVDEYSIMRLGADGRPEGGDRD